MQGYENEGDIATTEAYGVGRAGELPPESIAGNSLQALLRHDQLAGQPGQVDAAGIEQECEPFQVPCRSPGHVRHQELPAACSLPRPRLARPSLRSLASGEQARYFDVGKLGDLGLNTVSASPRERTKNQFRHGSLPLFAGEAPCSALSSHRGLW
jgi:hypothetical protein